MNYIKNVFVIKILPKFCFKNKFDRLRYACNYADTLG